MKLTILSLLALPATGITARFIEQGETQAVIVSLIKEPQYLIEFSAGSQQWVTESQKWDIKRRGEFFMDITDHQDLLPVKALSTKNRFPAKTVQQKQIFDLFKSFDKTHIKAHLEHFVTFHNRYYKSPTGEESSKWLLSTINETIVNAGADEHGVTIKTFEHAWKQSSIIVTIPGKTNSTVAVGAHQDSVNHADPMNGRAPGADDDGSGTMTILEVLRVMLSSPAVLAGQGENTIEFHWYSAEEGGCLGSQDIWNTYAKEGKDVKAMIQQDMTGFVSLTKGDPVFGLMMDIMDPELMEFLKVIINAYSRLNWVETGCGRTCGSDHQSAVRAGFPAVFIIEAAFPDCDLEHLHGPFDLIKYLDYDHMIDHAEVTMAFIYELAFAKL